MSVAKSIISPAQFVVMPNRSLSWEGNKLFIASLAIISFSIAGGFAWLGMWVILPFAGLEMAALAAGLYVCSVRSQRREVISIDENYVVIESGRNAPAQSVRFQRAWTNVLIEPAPIKGHPPKLQLRSMGKSVEIGAFLTESERKELAQSLENTIKRR